MDSGLKEVRRTENEEGRYTLVFLAAPGDEDAQVELTFNWDPEVYTGGRNFGHLAYEVDDIYALCQHLQSTWATPSTVRRATAAWRSCARPDEISVEIDSEGRRSTPEESVASRCPTPASGGVRCTTTFPSPRKA